MGFNSSPALLRRLLLPLAFCAGATGPLRAAPMRPVAPAAKPPDASAQIPNPQAYNRGTPERTLAEFLAAWRSKNFNQMAQATDITWKHTDATPIQTLRKQFMPVILVSARIIGPGKDEWSPQPTENIACLKMSLRYRSHNGLHAQTLSATVMRELRPYVQDRRGTWGVNPEFTVELDK